VTNYGLFKEPIIGPLKFKMADGPHLKSFGYNSAADCPISVKFCAGKQFFTEFQQWDRQACRVPQNVFFCFANAFWALASGGFHIVTVVTILGEMTDAGKRMNQLRFRSYPADVLIRINPKIQIAGSVLLQILALVEVCAVLVQSSLGLLPRD